MSVLSLILKVFALTIVLFVCFAVAAGVIGLQSDVSQGSEGAGDTAAVLLVVCFLNTLVLTYVILRSRWTGWQLIVTVFFILYSVMTFMSQIETAVFVTSLPTGVLPRLFLMGALVAAPFSVLAILILGKGKRVESEATTNIRLVMPMNEWVWRLAAIAFAYLVLYFTFGYFIAWRNPAVREFYAGTDAGGFVAHMSTVVTDTSWLIPFQILRAMLWVAIALPVIRMMKGRWHETALALGSLFAILMNAQLLLPNPYMPDAVRIAHLLETASSNFVFGLLVGWLLTHPERAREGQRDVEF